MYDLHCQWNYISGIRQKKPFLHLLDEHWNPQQTTLCTPSGIALAVTRLCFYQTRSAWSVDQGSNKNHSPAYNFAPTVTKFCVMWEGLSLPHDTTFGNCRCKIVDSRAFPSWSLIHGLCWSGLIKAEPGGIASQLDKMRFVPEAFTKSYELECFFIRQAIDKAQFQDKCLLSGIRTFIIKIMWPFQFGKRKFLFWWEAWCHQASNHSQSQSWPKSVTIWCH